MDYYHGFIYGVVLGVVAMGCVMGVWWGWGAFERRKARDSLADGCAAMVDVDERVLVAMRWLAIWFLSGRKERDNTVIFC